MKLQNYYQLLNIKRSADLDAIKKAFRTEIALYHPDKNTSEGARIRFDLLIEGFDILSNPKKREAYDNMLGNVETNKPVLIEPKAEEQYKEWKKESKKKSDTYWLKDLSDLLLLDLFLDVGLSSLFSGTDDLLDGLGDSLGDIFDVF
ncbi:DnaJ domain-containing protein [Formosa sp. Hel1_31_208]|uniref:J domain-containing protein n=1 Tax=Formosa sp. Hel1_31_208 TaxID=1798225 RepID=UPI00087A85EE|nr:J domain-containing protein [Formosa sp. Hel1_31_208]SDS67384.1 DnaJ domain-containing protein [Formosa sp. Hel1_31_208]